MARPAKSSRPPLKRVQMDLPPKSLDRLKRLQEVTEASSYAEVIRNALRLYEAIVTESENGGELMLRREGLIQPLHVFAG
jgi:hypothetical protein